jgi:uncharacterized protein
MRVMLDANVFLSYLLAPDAHGTIARIVQAVFSQEAIEFIVPPELIEEISAGARSKSFFKGKVDETTLTHLLTLFQENCTLPETIQEDELAHYVRDRKDDYLVVYGLLWDVEYLVTGDKDLLDLGQIESLRIVLPRTFYQILLGLDSL